MANLTCGAALTVAATGPGEDFPVIFPFYFGPTAAMTSSGAEWIADSRLSVTAHPTAAATRALVASAHQTVVTYFQTQAGHAWIANANLTVRSFDIPFPYIFPFVFNLAPVSMSFGKEFHVSQQATATPSGTVSQGQPFKVQRPIVVTLLAGMLQGHERLADVSLTVGTNPAASMTRNAGVDAHLDLVGLPYRFPYRLPFRFWEPANVAWGARTSASLQAVLATTTAMVWNGGMVAPLTITVATPTQAGFNQAINAALPVTTSFPVTVGHGQSFDAGQTITAEMLTQTRHGMSMQAVMPVAVLFDVTHPDFTTFWPFFNIS